MYQNLKLNKLLLKSLKLFHLLILFKASKLFKFLKLTLFVFICFSLSAFFVKKAKAESSKFLFMEENKATRLFLYPARISLLSLPCPITKALLGSPKDIKVKTDDLNPNEISLLLKKWNSQSSNLIVKCNDLVFLFNLIPSKSRHDDFIIVLGLIPKKPFKVKSKLNQKPSSNFKRFKLKDFKILKLLDFSLDKK